MPETGPFSPGDFNLLDTTAEKIAKALVLKGLKVERVRISCVVNVATLLDDEEHEAVAEKSFI